MSINAEVGNIGYNCHTLYASSMPTIAVAVKAVIRNIDGKYLILKKSSIEDVGPNDYDIPGGRIEFGEQPEEAIHREVKEETGLEVTIVKIFNSWSFVRDSEFQLTGMDFLCTSNGGTETITEEHTALFWLSAEEIAQSDMPSWLKKTIQKAEQSFSYDNSRNI